ncbi:MAG: hypothetical protein U0Q16_06395 [Bryobacteraceae bacterium]
MRYLPLFAAALAATPLIASPVAGKAVSQEEAQRLASMIGEQRPAASMYIWSDKYTYKPGEKLTLRWTVKPNDDSYAYTVVAFRQNNQNGKRFYLPAGTEKATDVTGKTVIDGFQATQLTAATKAVLIQDATIPDEPGMHTFVVQLRDFKGSRVLKAAYMKIGVVKDTVTLTGDITTNRLLTNDTLWNLRGVVAVKNNATLTVEPGTFIMGLPGSQPPSVLVITRGSKLVALGTKARPIVMTSSQPFGKRTRGDWGGMLMLGKAPVNVGANVVAGSTNQAGEFFVEGLPAGPDFLYGGNDPDDSCGYMSYLRIEYAGSILSPGNETNSFTFAGCGKGTQAHHLQAIYGLDDSFEWFGGTMDAKYLVGGLGADDYVDYQLGWTGRAQFGLFYQSPDANGNRGIEGDNSEYNNAALPYSNPTLFNMTFVGSGVPGFDEANAPGIFVRRGSRGSINNMVVTNFYSPGVDVADANTQAQADQGNLTMNGILLWNNGLGANPKAPNTVRGQSASGYTADFADGAKGPSGNPSGKNFLSEDPMLNRPLDWNDPDFVGRFGSPVFRAGFVAPPDDGFFDTVNFIGGIGDDDWTEEWTSFLNDPDIQ